ncbi:MAG TPA: CAP domain-containing protein [Thermoleophilaceae bacterium]
MVRTINYVRGWSHLRHLRYSARLSRGAAAWARHLMRRQMLAHASHVQGEIIEWHTGARAQIKQTVMEWLNSDGHRHVMLGHFRRAGAGRAVGYFGGRRCTIWVVRFAR